MKTRLDEVFKETEIEDPEVQLREAIAIGGDLRRELERLPVDIAHYGFLFAKAHKAWLTAKVTVEELRSAHSLSVREDLEALGEKVTEAKVDAKVSALAPIHDARAALIEAEFERESLRAVCDALRAKRENLQSLAYLSRAELASSGFREPSLEA